MSSGFKFNIIYIIESLPDDEPKTGEILYDDLIMRRTAPADRLYSKFIRVPTKEHFVNCLYTIKQYVEKGYYPFIHFEIHGSEKRDGLVLSSNEIVTWNELSSLTRLINISTKNNLVISLATCYGAYFNTSIKITDVAPFCGCVAAVEELSIGEIEVRFHAFFETILANTDFDLAVTNLNQAQDLPCKFRLITCEGLFHDLCQNMYQESFDSKHIRFRNRLNDLTDRIMSGSTVYANMKRKHLKEIVRKKMIEKKDTYFPELRSFFLLEN